MKIPKLSVAACLLAGVAGAQTHISVQGSTASVIGDFAQVGKTTQYKSIAKGTKFTTSLGVRAALRGAVAATGAVIRNTTRGVMASVHETGMVFSMSRSGGAVARTSKGADPRKELHLFDFRWSSRTAVKGKMILSLGGRAYGSAKTAAAVTIGSTTIRWNSSMRPIMKSLDVTVNATGLKVRVTTLGAAGVRGMGRASYMGMVSMVFVPAPSGRTCTVKPYGKSCATLAGKISSGRRGKILTMSLSGSLANGFGLTLIGTKQIKVQIPGTACYLLTSFRGMLHPFRTDAKGAATHSIHLPPRRSLSFNVQDVVLALSGRKLSISSSNGLAVTCR